MIYIFDIDGTIADASHRLKYIQQGKLDWDVFYQECSKDKPIRPVLSVLNALSRDAEIWFWTGRSDAVLQATTFWLSVNTAASIDPTFPALAMRAQGDHRPDDVLKREWYERIYPSHRARIVAVFEDRDRVVKMWRGLGVQCFQVANGDF